MQKFNLTIEELSWEESAQLREEWEALLSANRYTGFMQSLAWASFKHNSGQKVIHLVIRNDGHLIGGSLIYTTVDEKKPTLLCSPYGPVLPWDDLDLASACLKLLLEKTRAYAEKVNAVSWRIEPRLPLPIPRMLMEFAQAPLNLVPVETLILDLRPDSNSILAQMKPKCRYNIKLAKRRGVTVKELNDSEALNILYSSLEEASRRDDFYLEGKWFFEKLIDTMQPSGALKILVAEHENDCLGALVLLIEGNRATYLYGGISNKKRQLMPGYVLQWEAMQIAKSQGCDSYDFYGYDQFQSPGNAYALFSRFKSGFGGEVFRSIGAQDYVFMDKLVDNVINFFKDAERSLSL